MTAGERLLVLGTRVADFVFAGADTGLADKNTTTPLFHARVPRYFRRLPLPLMAVQNIHIDVEQSLAMKELLIKVTCSIASKTRAVRTPLIKWLRCRI
jgi:hypothetical protein